MDLYIGSLEKGLREAGFASRLMIMKASGGMMSSTAAKEIPVQTIESGPAGGTIGAARVAGALGIKNLIAIDMGGTTFKVSLVDNGVPRYRSEGELEWGVPFRMRMIDISEIGAGGGSIAWVDEGGLLRVGLTASGADPGPVCYGAGGKTDDNRCPACARPPRPRLFPRGRHEAEQAGGDGGDSEVPGGWVSGDETAGG